MLSYSVKECEVVQKNEFLKPKEAAERLNVNRMTIYRRINDGSLNAVWIRGWRIPAAELERYIWQETAKKKKEQSQKDST